MELSVLNIKGEDTGKKVTLNDAVFGIEPNEHAIYLDVKQFMANNRQGTHKSKERSEISGSTRKLKRQKGTGGARSGDINSPVMVGGALARKSALSSKFASNAITVVEDFTFEAPKTKEFIEFTKNLQAADKKLLLVLSDQNKNVYLSARNLPKAKVITVSELNTYKILDCENLVICESSVASINEF